MSEEATAHARGLFSRTREGFAMAELDPHALVTGAEAAALANVSPQAIVNWRRRGHLPIAELDARGRPRYRLLDVAKAERATAKAARRCA